MSDLLIGALIALGSAFLGAMVTWRNTGRVNQTAKENARLADGTTRALKLTDHRVAWLQRLRGEMAAFLSWGETPFVDHLTNRSLVESGALIRLLMNADDPDYEKLTLLIQKFQSAIPMDARYLLRDNYIAVCQQILKREWEVAKQELRAGKSDVDKIWFRSAPMTMTTER